MRYFARIFVALLAFACHAGLASAQTLPRSVLILDQADPNTPWSVGYTTALRAELRLLESPPVTIYSESLDLARFRSDDYEETLFNYLRNKYRTHNIGIVIAHGPRALEFYLRVRSKLWPEAPVIAALFGSSDANQLRQHQNITGVILENRFSNAVDAAKAIIPDFKQIALVGDPYERQPFRRHFAEQRKILESEVKFIDLLGLSMAELKKRVANLPADTVIFYTGIYVDGAGVLFSPRDALVELAPSAASPIVVDNALLVGLGPAGGIAGHTEPFAKATAGIASRIFKGEKAAEISVNVGDFVAPVFDWRQLRRFGISERNLPAGSEIRFKEFSFWERYRTLAIGILCVVLLQAMLIAWLLFERRRRRNAETESHSRLLETAHLNRSATAGALSASVAHELNQPLGAILSNTEAAERLLSMGNADPKLLQEILVDIRRDDQRAGEIIRRLRGLLGKSELKFQEFELDEEVRDVARMLDGEARKRGVVLDTKLDAPSAFVKADKVHVQQVLLNILMNGMDAMSERDANDKRLSLRSTRTGSHVEVTVSDNGCGIPEDKLKTIFDTFYTTKSQGTGLGLSIARTIIETYGGKIWAENRLNGGSAFSFTLPLTEARSK